MWSDLPTSMPLEKAVVAIEFSTQPFISYLLFQFSLGRNVLGVRVISSNVDLLFKVAFSYSLYA